MKEHLKSCEYEGVKVRFHTGLTLVWNEEPGIHLLMVHTCETWLEKSGIKPTIQALLWLRKPPMALSLPLPKYRSVA